MSTIQAHHVDGREMAGLALICKNKVLRLVLGHIGDSNTAFARVSNFITFIVSLFDGSI